MLEDLFIDVGELGRRFRRGRHTAVVWGTGRYAGQVGMTLEAFGVSVSFYGDNDAARIGGAFQGREVVGAERLREMESPLVVIGTMYIKAVATQMAALGVGCCALLDVLKYPYADHLRERRAMGEYFGRRCGAGRGSGSGNVLVEAYGPIGDVAVKLGAFAALMEKYGRGNVWFLCEEERDGGIAGVLRLISDNVVTLDRVRFGEDAEGRLRLLRMLNGLRFGLSVSISGLENHSQRRPLNPLNLNVRNVAVNRYVYSGVYMQGRDAAFVGGLVGAAPERLGPKGVLDGPLSKTKLPGGLPERYAAVALGASSRLRVYAAEKFAAVARFLAGEGWHMALLGRGPEDEAYYGRLIRAAGPKAG
ncbi:MAG: hypothetical protein LBJ10_10340, partial [Clostridiales bacterium]|nr:hypothetical protein [Clostridiales bacterium]